MTVPSPPADEHRSPADKRHGHQQPDQRRERARERRRLDEIFGDVLPTVTDDERDPGERRGFDVEYYRANRPPHHDR